MQGKTLILAALVRSGGLASGTVVCDVSGYSIEAIKAKADLAAAQLRPQYDVEIVYY